MSLPRLELRAGHDLLNEFGLTTETVADALDAVAPGGSVSAADISKAKALLVRWQPAPLGPASEGRCNDLALQRAKSAMLRSANHAGKAGVPLGEPAQARRRAHQPRRRTRAALRSEQHPHRRGCKGGCSSVLLCVAVLLILSGIATWLCRLVLPPGFAVVPCDCSSLCCLLLSARLRIEAPLLVSPHPPRDFYSSRTLTPCCPRRSAPASP
jgi:hypothetical protein